MTLGPQERRLAIAAGAALVIAAAILIAVMFLGESRRTAGPAADVAEICLKSDFPLVAGAGKKCFAPGGLAALAERPVVDDQGEPVALELTPPQAEGETVSVTTCNEYRALRRDGWFAATTRELRREAVFMRACDILAMLDKAKPPEKTFFDNAALSANGVAALASQKPFGFIAGAGETARPVSVTPEGESAWHLSAGEQRGFLQEIAHADFTDDGVGDVLVYMQLAVEGATVQAGLVGIVEKRSAAGALEFKEAGALLR